MKSKFFNAMLIIALLCTGGYATAQDKAKSNSKHTVKAQSADLATKLNLSESQNTSYQKIMTEHNSKLSTAKQKYGESSTKGQQKIADLETKKRLN